MRSSPRDATQLTARLRAAGCVFAEDEARLLLDAACDAAELEQMAARRERGEPLETVLGWVEFRGLRIAVDPGVFVPRRRTEALVAEAVRAARPGDVVVDLCCGSGAVGAAIAAGVPGIRLHAADIDPVAVRCARRNLHGIGDVHVGDLMDALPTGLRGRIAVLAVNAPYVPTSRIVEMPREARDHEPAVALDGGADGLDVHRRVAAEVAPWLAPGGRLVLETSGEQGDQTRALLAAAGLDTVLHRDPERDAVVAIGRRIRRSFGVPPGG